MYAVDEHSITIERKTAGEMAGNPDTVEARLKRCLDNPHVGEVGLIIEGVLHPTLIGTGAYKLSKDGRFFYLSRDYPVPFEKIAAFLYRIDKLGVWVLYSSCLASTAVWLTAIYHNAQKSEHTTFRRYVREKPQLWLPNPYVETLTGLSKSYVNLGEKLSLGLLSVYPTPWEVFNQSIESLCEVPDLGKIRAKGIYKAIGKPL